MRYIQKKAEPEFFKIWKQDFCQVYGNQPKYDDLKGTSTYVSLKKSLLEEQGYLCCYCEKRIGTNMYATDCDIEHFMPRHPDKRYLTAVECAVCENAQLDYQNIMVSCKGEPQDWIDHCNHKKDNWFDFKTCIAPTDKKIEELFGYSIDGKIYPIDGNQSGREMQEHMNLNSDILKRQRREAYITVLELEFDDEELLDDIVYINETIQEYRGMHQGKYYPFCSMITYCLEHFFKKEVL